jgi:hypothetical protein
MFVPVTRHDLVFQRHNWWSFFAFIGLRWLIVHFVDIDGIVDHHCLNFLFIIGEGDFKVETKISNHKKES